MGAAHDDGLHPCIPTVQTLVDAQEQLVDDFARLFKGAAPGGEVAFEVRPEILVQPARAVAAEGIFLHDDNVLHEEGLHRFPEGF